MRLPLLDHPHDRLLHRVPLLRERHDRLPQLRLRVLQLRFDPAVRGLPHQPAQLRRTLVDPILEPAHSIIELAARKPARTPSPQRLRPAVALRKLVPQQLVPLTHGMFELVRERLRAGPLRRRVLPGRLLARRGQPCLVLHRLPAQPALPLVDLGFQLRHLLGSRRFLALTRQLHTTIAQLGLRVLNQLSLRYEALVELMALHSLNLGQEVGHLLLGRPHPFLRVVQALPHTFHLLPITIQHNVGPRDHLRSRIVGRVDQLLCDCLLLLVLVLHRLIRQHLVDVQRVLDHPTVLRHGSPQLRNILRRFTLGRPIRLLGNIEARLGLDVIGPRLLRAYTRLPDRLDVGVHLRLQLLTLLDLVLALLCGLDLSRRLVVMSRLILGGILLGRRLAVGGFRCGVRRRGCRRAITGVDSGAPICRRGRAGGGLLGLVDQPTTPADLYKPRNIVRHHCCLSAWIRAGVVRRCVCADVRGQWGGDPLAGTRPWKPIAALGEHAGRRTTVRGSLARRLRL
ncbi:hypothetical protein, partial [Nocardia sp. NPDC004604]|uniref:hypothetical protein n=1 Tax=Nocardia sp. NPDC004604 TaxID=3157013 RepID=UPI0033AFFCE3